MVRSAKRQARLDLPVSAPDDRPSGADADGFSDLRLLWPVPANTGHLSLVNALVVKR